MGRGNVTIFGYDAAERPCCTGGGWTGTDIGSGSGSGWAGCGPGSGCGSAGALAARRWPAREAGTAVCWTGTVIGADCAKAGGGYLTGYPGGRTGGDLAGGAVEEGGPDEEAGVEARLSATRADSISNRC